jgi:PAS domain S-box-containing protein
LLSIEFEGEYYWASYLWDIYKIQYKLGTNLYCTPASLDHRLISHVVRQHLTVGKQEDLGERMTDHCAPRFQGNILLVDADQADLNSLAGILTQNGYNVRLCLDVASALTSAWNEPPTLILLAVDMPGVDGYGVCRQLKADQRTANVPVIVVNASREAANHAQALSAGVVDYISKPFQADEVLFRVEIQVNLHRMRQRLEAQNSLLQQEISQRKHIERELQRHSEQFGELVDARTAELETANDKLQRDNSAGKQAEDAPHHLTRVMVENMSDAWYWIDSNIRIVDVNETACRMLGYTREEFAHMSMFDIDAVPPFEVQPGFAEQIEQTGAATFETHHRTKDGRLVPVEVSVNIVKFGGQEFNCCFARDITERKRVAAALQESEEKYRSLVETAQDPIFIFDPDGHYSFVNRAGAGLFGLIPDTMIGKSAHDFFSTDIADRYREAVSQVFRTGTGLTVNAASEINGQPYWFSTNLHPIRDQHGHIKAVQGVARDITNLKRTDEALRESEGRLRRAELMAHMGHYAFDADLGNAIFSDGVKEIWGFERSSNPDVSQFLARLHPDDQWALAEMGKAAEEMRGFDLEYRIMRPDGSEVVVHSVAEITPNEPGRPPRFFGTMLDITERKKDKALLQRSREQLKAQYKSFPIPTYTYQRQGDEYVLIDYNDAAATTTQGGVASFVGRSLRESIANRPDLIRNVERCFHEKRTLKDEVIYKTQSTGQDGYFVSTYVFVPPDLVMVHTEDITESKQVEEALKVKDSAIASAINAIVIASADGTVTYVNPSFLRLWGFDNEQEVLGKSAQELWTHPPEDVPQVMESMKATGSWIGEVTATKKMGRGSMPNFQPVSARIVPAQSPI